MKPKKVWTYDITHRFLRAKTNIEDRKYSYNYSSVLGCVWMLDINNYKARNLIKMSVPLFTLRPPEADFFTKL